MNKEKLIENIKEAFCNEIYIGDNNIVYNNSENHLECAELKKGFIGKKWQDLNHELIFEYKDSLPFFSIEGLKYYTPAFLIDILHDYYESDTLIDNLLSVMTLPQEIDTVIMANNIKKYSIDEKIPEFNFEEFLYSQLDTTNERVTEFIKWANLFTIDQKKIIFKFLNFLDSNFSEDLQYSSNTPKNAITRFWFQFE